MRLDETGYADAARGMSFVNGNVITAESGSPRARAFAVGDGKFLRVGANEEARAAAPAGAPAVDLEGATVLPGLTDCHVHLLDYARGRSRLDLTAVTDSSELTRLVAGRVGKARPGEWILGQGWNDALWRDRRPPHRNLLDGVSPQNPVLLARVDIHTVLVNSRALEMAGVTRDTPNPPGGRIERERDTGQPTGVLVDDARSLVQELVPEPSSDEDAKALGAAMPDLSGLGLTAVHDAMATLELSDILRGMDDAGKLGLRVSLMLTYDEFEKLEALPARARAGALRPGRVTARTVKIFADGALGSRGALLSEPYSDDPSTTGVDKLSAEKLLGQLRRILRAGLQPAVHAIGDLACSRVLDAYERCAADPEFQGAFRAVRPRLEHAQILSRRDVARCGKLGLIVSIQPPQLISDMTWMEDRLGPERVKLSFLFGSLARAGATLVSGSDLPIESCDPFLGMYAAVARRNLAGRPAGGWLREERLSREAALRSYALDAAYSAFEETAHGSIAAGKSADFVVIDRDVLSVPEDAIHGTRVLATFARGRRV